MTRDGTGWTVGSVEYAFLPHWSAKIDQSGNHGIVFPQTVQIIALRNFNNWGISRFVHSIKVGLNDRFGGARWRDI